MTKQTIEIFSSNMIQLFESHAQLKIKRNSLIDRRGNPIIGRENDLSNVDSQIEASSIRINQELTKWCESEEKRRLETPTIPSDVIMDCAVDAILSATHYESKKGIHVRVPVGQIFVVGSSSDPIDTHGFPEVYLPGEFIDKKHEKDAWTVALSEYPALITLEVQHTLAGISSTPENKARAFLKIPTRLQNPIKLVSRAGKRWQTDEGQKTVNLLIGDQIQEHLIGLLNNGQMQIWSEDPQNVVDFIFRSVENIIKDWGIVCNLESISLDREFPANLYKIVLELISTEQLITSLIHEKSGEKLSDRTGLSEEQLARLRTISSQNVTRGLYLYSYIRNMDKLKQGFFVNWLKEIRKNYLANFIIDLYSDSNPENEIKLSEQVVTHALKNPVLCVGESLDFTSEWESFYSRLQAEMNLGKE